MKREGIHLVGCKKKKKLMMIVMVKEGGMKMELKICDENEERG